MSGERYASAVSTFVRLRVRVEAQKSFHEERMTPIGQWELLFTRSESSVAKMFSADLIRLT